MTKYAIVLHGERVVTYVPILESILKQKMRCMITGSRVLNDCAVKLVVFDTLDEVISFLL